MAAVVAVKLNKCSHGEEQKIIRTVNHKTTLHELFEEVHGKIDEISVTVQYDVSSNVDGTCTFKSEGQVCVGDLTEGLKMKYVEFKCQKNELTQLLENVVEKTTRQTVNAFQILMAGGRTYTEKKTKSCGVQSGLNNKDVLYNKLVDLFHSKKVDFPKCVAATEGSYFIQVLCNALWYITNSHNSFDAARIKIPKMFRSEDFKNHNDTRRKKVKSVCLKASELESHSQAIYSLLLKPVAKSTPAWSEFHKEIQALGDCLNSYKDYLNNKAKEVTANHRLDHPVRTVGKHTTVEPRPRSHFGVHERYALLDSKIKELDTERNFLFFNENEHLTRPFANNMQRYRFLNEIQLSMPIDVYKFSPGGSILSTICFVHTDEGRNEAKMLTDAARFVLLHKDKFQEFHTRAQKQAFKQKLQNVSQVAPSVADFIYKELTIDAATASHPDTQERIRLIFLGEQGLLTDMRKINPGRPSGTFDTFFEHLANIVEDKTTVDDRRHNTAHLSEWLSLSDMIQMAKQRCPENTAIPSKSLVRLQFAPRNPYAKTAWNFTSRIDVQYKIQRRQLRLSHLDEHYCNAQFKYIKEFAVEMKKKAKVVMVCCDDKAKVPVGEPGFAVSTGVRGKQTIVPTSVTLVAADHDMTKSSLTPSVTLKCKIPDTCDESFVRGQVTVTVNDSVFQSSNPFRHAVTLSKILQTEQEPTILVKFSDGGTDHRNTLESVKCATICLFRELNLDMIILGRCTPGHSWRNPAERVMSILNLGLQNCSIERQKCDENTEKFFKTCGSMSDIRSKSSDDMKQKYIESVEPVASAIRNRFQRLKLKDDIIATMDPVTDQEIDIFKRHLRELFPELDLEKLQKQHTHKVASYLEWISKHCRERHYLFQVKKCSDENCCLPKRVSDDLLKWLPDPVLMEGGDHFRSYQESKGKETEETDRPTYKTPPKPKRKRVHSPEREFDDEHGDDDQEDGNDSDPDLCPSKEREAIPLTAQHARGVINCVECRKPRLYYSKLRLSGRQEQLIAIARSEYDFTCGGPIADPSVAMLKKVFVREKLTCAYPVETPYYSSAFAKLDLCAHCANDGGVIDIELRKKYKTILPICNVCSANGKVAIVMRQYGQKRK